MLGPLPIPRLRTPLTPRTAVLLLAALFALGAACTEGGLPTQPHGYVPVPTRVRLNATVANSGRAMKIVARYAKRTDTLQVTPFDSTTLTLTGTETQLPVKLDIAPCLAAADRELPPALPADQSASVCVLRLVVTLLDANGQVIDQSALAPIVARPGEEAQAPPVSLGIPVGKVTVSPKAAVINALTRTLDLAVSVVDRNNAAIATPALAFATLDPAIATVDTTTGRVTARAVGTARIVATSRDKADTATITVRQVAKTVALSAPVTSLFVGDSVQVTAAVQDSAGVTIPVTAAAVSFRSSDTTAAVVSASGMVTARRDAAVTITGTSGTASGTLALTVSLTPVATVTIAPSPDTVGIGMASQLAATLRGANGATLTGRSVVWTSADTLKAKVDTLGLVTGRAVGTTTVTATSEGKSATATVVIEPPLFCPSGAPRADTTLQATIARTPANGTAYVCDGTFTIDSVRVTKAMTLRAQHTGAATLVEGDPNVTAIQTGRPALIVDGTGAGLTRLVGLGFRMKGRGITIAGAYDQVLVDSSTFFGVDSTTSIPISVGASSVATAHVDITNSQFDHFGIGVFLISPTETFVRRNLFQNFNGGGVLFSGTYAVGRVEDNTFRSCSRDCVRALLIGPYAVIARNRMEIPGGSNGFPAILAQRALTTPSRQPIIIEDNVIVGAATGADPLTAAGWSIQAGISVNDSIGVENIVRGNQISGAWKGVLLTADARVTDNVVTGSGYAFHVNASTVTATIQRNDFTNLASSFLSSSTLGSYQCDWWGSTNGPTPAPAGVPSGMYSPVASQPIAGQAGVSCVPVAPVGARVWTGATSSDWSVASNWSPAQVPTSSDSVVINAGGTQPVLTSAVTVRRLVIGSGATLSTGVGYGVRVDSGLVTNGSITGIGTLTMAGGASRLAGSGVNLALAGHATATLTGSLQLISQLSIGDTSSLTLAGHFLSTQNTAVSGLAVLSLTNAADTLDVTNALTFGSTAGTAGHLTAGVVRLAGGLNVNVGTLSVGGTRFIATGTTDQFWSLGNNAQLADLVFANTGAVTNGVYLYNGTLAVTGSITQQSGTSTIALPASVLGNVVVASGTMHVQGSLDLTGGGQLQTAAGTTLDGGGGIIVRGPTGTGGILGGFSLANVGLATAPRQAVTLNPALAYQNLALGGGSQVALTATTAVTGNLVLADSASLSLTGHRLSAGTLQTQNVATLDVVSTADTLDVATSLSFGSTAGTSGHLTAGVVRLAGGLNTTAGTLFSTGTRFVATGPADQFWSVGNNAQLTDLVLANTGGVNGVYIYNGAMNVIGTLTQQSGTSTIALPMAVSGTVALNAGAMHIQSSLDLISGGALQTAAGTTLDGGGSLVLRNAAGTSGILGSFSVNALTLASLARQAVTLTPTLAYQTLMISGGSQVSLTGAVAVASSLTLADSARLALAGHHLTVSTLQMQNASILDVVDAADTLDVSTSLNFASTAGSSGHLTAGLARIAGGLSVNAGTLASTGTRFVATGGADQFWSLGNNAQLVDLVLANSGGVNGVYFYNGTLAVTGNVTQQSGTSTIALPMTVGGTVAISAGTMHVQSALDLTGGGQLQAAAGTTVDGGGSLTLRNAAGTSTVLGGFSTNSLTLAMPFRSAIALKPSLSYSQLVIASGSQVSLTGTITATQSVIVRDSANLTLGGHRLTTASMQTTDAATIDLLNGADTLDVTSSMSFGSVAGTSGHLNAGTLRLGGSLTTTTQNLTTNGTQLVANGTADQFWAIGTGSSLSSLVLANTGGGTNGVYIYNGSLAVTGNLTLQTGKYTNALNTSVAGTLTLAAGTKLDNQSVLKYGTFVNQGATITGNPPVQGP